MAKANGKAPAGRPTDFDANQAAEICARIADGRSLRSVCGDDDMPSVSTVFLWLGRFPTFSEQYVRSCEDRAEHHFEEALEIADDARNDWMQANDPENPGWKFNSEHVNRSRLRIDTRKWFLSKMMPKKYGDKIEVERSGTITHTIPGLENLPADKLSLLTSILEEAAATAEMPSKPNGKMH